MRFLQEVISKSHDIDTGATNPIPSDDIPNRCELHLRSTRGIPPKSYDPEFEAQRSRYLVYTDSEENLSQTVISFTAS